MAFLFAKSFPFCIPLEKETKDIPVGSGTNYPIGMNLEDAMYLFWKNKTFSSIVSYSASVLVPNDGNPFSVNASVDQNGQLSLASPLWPTKMSGMICKSIPDGYLPYFAGQSGVNGVITSSLETPEKTGGQVDVILFSVLGGIIIRGDAYYPEINASSYITFSGNNFYSASVTSIVRDNARTLNDALNIKINGTEYKTDLFSRIGVNEFVFSPDSASASFEISGLNDREAN